MRSTRELEAAAIGSSVRGSLALESAARAWALLRGRTYVVPADVELLFTPVVMHRIVFRPSFLAEVRRVGWPAASGAAAAGLPGERAAARTVGRRVACPRSSRSFRSCRAGRCSASRTPRCGAPAAASGTDIAGSRPYRPGDNVDNIDWAASARLSTATGLDEFIVRERFADEAPWVVVLADRRPSMALYPEPYPWLRKFEALEHAVEIVLRSALAARSLPAYLDFVDGEAYWRAPRARRELWQGQERARFNAPRTRSSRASSG